MTQMKPGKGYTLFSLALIFSCLTFLGCGGHSRSGGQRANRFSQSGQNDTELIRAAFDFTLDTRRFEEKAFKKQMIENLNRWIGPKKELNKEPWEPTEMLGDLPEELQAINTAQTLPEFRFIASDADFLQWQIWMRAVADRTAARPLHTVFPYLVSSAASGLSEAEAKALYRKEDRLPSALRIHYPELSPDDIELLVWACRLFDWTTRNVQLDRTPIVYRGQELLIEAKKMVDNPIGNQAADGIPGPGYTKPTGEVLLTGKGDVWERSRVYIELCRQVGIDAVLINVNDRVYKDRPVAWTIGLPIAEKIFLFDMVMGIPFPSKDYSSIATLDEVLQDRTLLTQLKYKVSESTDADSDYRIRPDQLDELTCWIDASDEFLSRRMELLEPSLSGNFKIKISIDPKKLKAKLPEEMFEKIELSPLPFQSRIYQQAFAESMRKGKEAALQRYHDMIGYFQLQVPVKKVKRQDLIDNQTESIREGQKLEVADVELYQLAEARHMFLLGAHEIDQKRGLQSVGAMKLQEDLALGRDVRDATEVSG